MIDIYINMNSSYSKYVREKETYKMFYHLLYPITRLVIQKMPNGIIVQIFRYVVQMMIDSKRNAVVDTK